MIYIHIYIYIFLWFTYIFLWYIYIYSKWHVPSWCGNIQLMMWIFRPWIKATWGARTFFVAPWSTGFLRELALASSTTTTTRYNRKPLGTQDWVSKVLWEIYGVSNLTCFWWNQLFCLGNIISLNITKGQVVWSCGHHGDFVSWAEDLGDTVRTLALTESSRYPYCAYGNASQF